MNELKRLQFECDFKSYLFKVIFDSLDSLSNGYRELTMTPEDAKAYLCDVFKDASVEIINILERSDDK